LTNQGGGKVLIYMVTSKRSVRGGGTVELSHAGWSLLMLVEICMPSTQGLLVAIRPKEICPRGSKAVLLEGKR
jgi:hypothetical protein